MDRGGLERQLSYLLRALDRDRYRPAVVLWNGQADDLYLPELAKLDVPVYSLHPSGRPWVKLRKLQALVRALRPEVLHSYTFYTNIAAECAAWGTPAIPVGSVRSDFVWAKDDSGPVLGRLSARWPRYQIFNSDAAARAARAAVDFFVPHVAGVVRNGLDFDQFPHSPLMSEGEPRILGIGYLLPVKRWDRLLTAIQAVRREGLRCTVQIAGDGPLGPALARQAQDLGIADCLEFLGHTADVPRLLAQCTFVVHTADAEGCPNAVLEAMACGRAVIATEAGDVPAVIQHGKTGFVVPRDEHAALVHCIATLIADRALCVSMGVAARAAAEENFALQRVVTETLAFYRRAGWQDSRRDQSVARGTLTCAPMAAATDHTPTLERSDCSPQR